MGSASGCGEQGAAVHGVILANPNPNLTLTLTLACDGEEGAAVHGVILPEDEDRVDQDDHEADL